MPAPDGWVPERHIDCIDCGGVCSLLTPIDDDEFPLQPGDLLTYRCRDCNDRWDLLAPGDEGGGQP